MPISIVKHTVAILTDTGGDFSAETAPVNGRVLQMRYVPDGSAPLDTGADLDVTLKGSGVVVANEDNIGGSAFTRAYRQATHGADGSASLYAGGGEPVEDFVVAAGEVLEVTIDAGGNGRSGTLYIWTG